MSEVAESMADEGLGGDLASQLGVAEPQPVYAAVASCPVLNLPGGIFVAGAAASVDILTRNRDVRGSGALGNTGGAARPLIPLDLDRPEHTGYRKLLDPIFAPHIVAPLEADVRALADQLIDGFIDDGRVDLYDEFCAVLPSTIFLRLMGIPDSELAYFLEFKNDILREVPDETVDERSTRSAAAGLRCYDYFNNVLDAREAAGVPGDDLLGRFLTAEVDGQRLTRENILDICYLLMIAGLDTVAASLSCIIAWLAQHPAERDEIVADPTMWSNAIEELMRWETPVPVGSRTPMVDLTIGDEVIPAGTNVTILWAAANVDPAKFEDPLTVDLRRSPNPHYSFASGFHRCLGSHLARLELRVALDQFHQRIPDYRVESEAELQYEAIPVRLVRPLPLVWSR